MIQISKSVNPALIMEQSRPFNIFDPANQSSQKKDPLEPSRESQPIPSSSLPTSTKKQEVIKKKSFSNQEIEHMFESIYNMKDELEKRLSFIYEKTGFSKREVDNFFDNPNNFPPEKWQQMQKERQKLENQILAVIGSHEKSKLSPKYKETSGKGRKTKTIGARKNWIPMR